MRGTFLLLGVALILAACRPVYETGYRLEPPADAAVSPAVKGCLAACASGREACLGPARQSEQRCEERASLRQSSCQANAQIDFDLCLGNARSTGGTCFMRPCERPRCAGGEVGACEAENRRCFAACGGTVVEEPRCVANCPS